MWRQQGAWPGAALWKMVLAVGVDIGVAFARSEEPEEEPRKTRATSLKSQFVELSAQILGPTMKSSGRPMSLFAQTTISGGRRLFRR